MIEQDFFTSGYHRLSDLRRALFVDLVDRSEAVSAPDEAHSFPGHHHLTMLVQYFYVRSDGPLGGFRLRELGLQNSDAD